MRLFSSSVLVGALLCAASASYAQQAPSQAPAASSPSTPASTSTPASPATPAASNTNNAAPTMAQKAKEAGMKQESHGGTTYYCWKETVPNSRLPEKRCVNDDQLQAELDRRQARREQFQQSAAPGVAGK